MLQDNVVSGTSASLSLDVLDQLKAFLDTLFMAEMVKTNSTMVACCIYCSMRESTGKAHF